MEASVQLQAPAILPPGKRLRKAKCVFCVCVCVYIYIYIYIYIVDVRQYAS
jgi:hypothetical protein